MFVTSSTNPGFGGWFDDPIIRMIQVERLKPQPCPMLFSECFAPSVSHLGDENNDLCQLLASDPSLCSIFNAESLLRRAWGAPTNAMKLERNSKSIVQHPQRWNHGPAIYWYSRLCFTSSQCSSFPPFKSGASIRFTSHQCPGYWVHVVSCLVSPEVVSGRCAVGKCV